MTRPVRLSAPRTPSYHAASVGADVQRNPALTPLDPEDIARRAGDAARLEKERLERLTRIWGFPPVLFFVLVGYALHKLAK